MGHCYYLLYHEFLSRSTFSSGSDMGVISRVSCNLLKQMTSCYLLLLILVRDSPNTRTCTDLEESQPILNVENIFEFQCEQNQINLYQKLNF